MYYPGRKAYNKTHCIRAPVFHYKDNDGLMEAGDYDRRKWRRNYYIEKPRVPTFIEEIHEHSALNNVSHEELRCKDKCPKPGFMDCPICMDFRVESTTTKCGHKFCRECLDQWTVLKPLCPICGTEVKNSEKIRLYEDDCFLEKHFELLPGHVQSKWRIRTSERQHNLKKENSKWMTRVKKKYNEYKLFMKCKGASGIARSTWIKNFLYRAMKTTLFPGLGFFTGLIVGILLGSLFYYWNFIQNFFLYLYLTIKNFDGTVPRSIHIEYTPATLSSAEAEKNIDVFSVVTPKPVPPVSKTASAKSFTLHDEGYGEPFNLFRWTYDTLTSILCLNMR